MHWFFQQWLDWLFGEKGAAAKSRASRRTVLTVEQLEDRCVPSTITVTGSGDGFGRLTKTGATTYTATTLRRAILVADALASKRPGPNTIIFDIPGAPVIKPATDLPVITSNQITIDGTTQPGYDATNFIPVVTVDGSLAGAGADGFTIKGNNNVLKGLIIVNFSGNGVWMKGTLQVKLRTFKGGGGNQLINDFIGTNAGSAGGLGNGTGVRIQDAGNNLIGGFLPSNRDVISGNRSAGVLIVSSNFNQVRTIPQNNQVFGNYIGTNVAGTAALGSTQQMGVSIEGGDSNFIRSNVISGNIRGVNVASNLSVLGPEGRRPDSLDNVIQSNVIGLDKTGEKKIGNLQDGIVVSGSGNATGNLIGGDQPSQGNIVAGNKENIKLLAGSKETLVFGNYIGTDGLGQTVYAGTRVGLRMVSSSGNLVGGSERGQANVISGNGIGVSILNMDAMDNDILNNIIGLSSTGGDLGSNQQIGVNIDNSPSNHVIGNVISGNVTEGVRLAGNAAEVNEVSGNRIGTDPTGTEAVGTQRVGVLLTETANNNLIGREASDDPSLGNTISGNGVGVKILLAGTTLNRISFNYIGTNLSGSVAVPNKKYGVLLDAGAADNTVAGNVISGNGWSGIGIFDQAGGTVESNLIGTDVSGTSAIPNGRFGKLTFIEQVNGIIIDSSSRNTVRQNVVSGNMGDGIVIAGARSTLNVLTQNIIGLDKTGTKAVRNGKNGVEISSSASQNTIGGAGLDNVISGNSGSGIMITGMSTKNQVLDNIIGLDSDGLVPFANLGDGVHLGKGATGNTIQKSKIWFNKGAGIRDENAPLSNTFTQNSIFDNGALGIDDGPAGVTLVSIPLFTGAQIVGNQLLISGTLLNAAAGTNFVIEFFDNQQPDPSGFGEGQTYLGSTTVATDGSGQTYYTVAFPLSSITGGYITATATDAYGTSEFSTWITADTIAATSGTPQSTFVSTSFSQPLEATVNTGNGQPAAGVTVTFQAPTSGAGGTFANGLTTVQEITNSQGIAVAPFAANGTAGNYVVTATIAGAGTPADFDLTNYLPSTLTISADLLTLNLTTNGTQSVGSGIPFIATDTLSGGVSPAGTLTFKLDDPNGNLVFTDNVTVTGDGIYTAEYFPTVNGTYTWLVHYQGTGNPTPQQTTITTTFGTPLAAVVDDAAGNPVPGTIVTFAAPTSGPSGTFAGGASSIQVTTDSNGVAIAPFTANGTAGSYIVTATSAGAGTPANFALTNLRAVTTADIYADTNQSLPGDPVTFTVAVLSPFGTPTGQVEFFDGETALGFGTLNGSGLATFTTSNLTLGLHAIGALYLGDPNFLASASNSLLQTVGIPTGFTLFGSSFNPSITGADVDFSANVEDSSTGLGVTTGAVQFSEVLADGSTVLLGTSSVDSFGTAELSVDTLLPPGNEIIATYLGSGDYLPSTSQFFQVVNPNPTDLSLTAGFSTVTAGQTDNLNVFLETTPVNFLVVQPTGTMSLFSSFDGGSPTLLLQIPVGGSGSFPGLTEAGTYVLYVSYSGDNNFTSSTSNSITITVTGSTTTTGMPWTLTDPVSAPQHGKPGHHDDRDAFFAYYEEWMHDHRGR